ncbi:hypothetical protein GFL88_34570 [Rhizobium leguminosarum bv. viciae]|uniref:hypothetical protein n=1 Tax=Rhizobium leguminosarum TaxID=384 RepID=UPI001442965A|nr:hypothetical protein [Rhizobium leguminosarum]NKK68504.1 hypothetical protein [Rhizobium leguminosarum bv. viciae]
MTTPSDIYRLTTGAFPARYHDGTQLEGPVYGAQLMFSGPDAAIEVVGKKITPYMFGHPTDNTAFAALIENYESSILKQSRKLRKAPDDRVVFTGVWYHIDFSVEPRFEPYVIHVVSNGGNVSTSRYMLEMFDYDYPGEGFKGWLALEVTSPAAICNVLKSEAAKVSRVREMSHETAGFKPLQGAIWYPADDNDEEDLPIIVSKLFTVTASDQEPDYDPDVFAPEASDPLREEFSEALTEASEKIQITSRLADAFKAIWAEKASDADRQWMLREMSQTVFGVFQGELVIRAERSGPITLTDLANSSTATGSWFQVRNGDDIHEALFSAFDDDDRCQRDDVVLKERQGPAAEGAPECLLETEWIQRGPSTAVRYLAIGPEPRLSW